MLSNTEKTHSVLCANCVSTEATYITLTPQRWDGWFLWYGVNNAVFSCWLKVCHVVFCEEQSPKSCSMFARESISPRREVAVIICHVKTQQRLC